MLRTSSHFLPGLTAPLVSILLLTLGGCVVYTNSPPPPPPPHARAVRPAPPPRRVHTGPATPAPTATATATPAPGRPPRNPDAPRITSPILFGNGTGGAFKGQAYVITEGTRLVPDFDQLVPFATLYTDSFNITPQTFSGGFPGALKQDDWFGIRYEGTFIVPTAGGVGFDLTSDDGAVLYIDGQKVIDNDGLHGPTAASARRDLSPGYHRLRLDYFQGARGPVALTLFMTVAGQKAVLMGVKPR